MGVQILDVGFDGHQPKYSILSPPVQVIPESDSDCSVDLDCSGLLDQAFSQGDASPVTDDSEDDSPLVHQKVPARQQLECD